MVRKYLSLEEAATKLGMTGAELRRLKDQGEIRGFADRNTLKFRSDDVEELQRRRQADSDPDVPLITGGGAVVGDEDEVSEQPTEIRRSIDDEDGTPSDSDVRMIFHESLQEELDKEPASLADSDSDIRLVTDDEPLVDDASDSDVQLVGSDNANEVPLSPNLDDEDSHLKALSSDHHRQPEVNEFERKEQNKTREMKAPDLSGKENLKESQEQDFSLADEMGSDSDVQVIGPEDQVSFSDSFGSESDVQVINAGDQGSVIDDGVDESDSASDVQLIKDDPGSDSDVKLVPGSSTQSPRPEMEEDSDVSIFAEDSGIGLMDDDPDKTMAGGSGISLESFGDSGITLESQDSGVSLENPDSGLTLEEPESDVTLSGDSGLALEGDSDIALEGDSGLALEGDSDLALDDGDDLTLSGDSGIALETAGDSGINLFEPADSGISLDFDDEQTVTEGSFGDSGLALERADDNENTVPLMDASESGGDQTDFEVPLMEDDEGDESEFELSAADDDEDQTSVILFEDEDEVDDYAQTVVRKSDGDVSDDFLESLDEPEEFDELEVTDEVIGEDDELGDDLDVFDATEEEFEDSYQSGATQFQYAPQQVAAPAEQEWGVGTFVGLSMATILLALCGMMMFDLVRSIWSWEQPNVVSSALLEALRPLFGS